MISPDIYHLPSHHQPFHLIIYHLIGTVDRIEWISYNASYDHETGELLFNHAMREEFMSLDEVGDGGL